MQKVAFWAVKGGLLYAKRRPFTIVWQSSCWLRGCRFALYGRLGAGGLLMTLLVVKSVFLALTGRIYTEIVLKTIKILAKICMFGKLVVPLHSQIRNEAQANIKHRGVEQLVARQAHNLEVACSSPASATTWRTICCYQHVVRFLFVSGKAGYADIKKYYFSCGFCRAMVMLVGFLL